jgi:hypothetical protein
MLNYTEAARFGQNLRFELRVFTTTAHEIARLKGFEELTHRLVMLIIDPASGKVL